MTEHQVTAPQSTATCLALGGAQTVRTIDAAYRNLTTALAEHATVTIDCSAASEVDLSLIQLLLAAHAAAARAGKTVALAAPASGVLLAALVQGGFLPQDATATGPDAAFWLHGTAA
jgi:ABC-type transporter Mla MlaB component